jgi:hypothetical protein
MHSTALAGEPANECVVLVAFKGDPAVAGTGTATGRGVNPCYLCVAAALSVSEAPALGPVWPPC